MFFNININGRKEQKTSKQKITEEPKSYSYGIMVTFVLVVILIEVWRVLG